jgi:DNA invertase Pin-like site-specific DNA recombinase
LAKYVAYYQVRSGPGEGKDTPLSVQREAVSVFVAGSELVEEFTEDERQHQRRRPHFEAALKSARRHRAILVIPRFRPIHRSPAFVDRLRDEGVDFVALDMPGASRAMVASLAAAAAQRRHLISERIKASLQVAKARGRQLGNPDIAQTRPEAVRVASEVAQGKRRVLWNEVVKLHEEGRSLRAIAGELNRTGIPSARGGGWHASSVRRILTEAMAESA